MAIIYTNRNDNVGSHTTVDPNVTSTWVGGVVPTGVDQVYIVGRRTTINQTAFPKWEGTRTITVASTANFASVGFFYTVTDQGEIVKINYTGTTATTFTGCSVDESDSFYAWTGMSTASSIYNGAYVHNPAYIVEIGSGETFTCNELIIQEGGWLHIASGGTLVVNQGIIVRDGRLIGRGNGQITISRPAGTTTSSAVGYLTAENFQLSVIDIDGGEVRTYATLASNANKGNCAITVSNVTNGTFAVGDEIAVYELNDYRRRNKGYTGYRDASCSFVDMDEGFDVVGVDGNTIYVGMRNGATGTVKAVDTQGGQKILNVIPDDIYFNAGDKIVIDNNIYTIDSTEDSEHLLYDYDFTNPATDLSDFWIDDATAVYSGGWSIEEGVGIRNPNSSYRELVHKYLWTREVIVEAEMSPLSAFYSGTRGANAFGIMTAYDPAFRRGHRAYDGFKSNYLIIDDSGQDFYFSIRSMTNYANNRPDRITSVLNATRTAATYTVDIRKNRATVFFNGEEFTTEFMRNGNFKGLVGIYANNNPNMRCRRLTIKKPTQRLYITTNNTISVDAKVYQSGIDHNHPVGSRVVKIAAINTGEGNHQDLAFAYRGQRGNGEFPLIIQQNGVNTTNTDIPYVHNHDLNPDYYRNLGDGASARSLTIDLQSQRTFTHVSFVPRSVDAGTYMKMNGVAIYGSNDLSTWDTLYGPTNDTRYWERYNYNTMGFYPTGTVSYRYVKFETAGFDFSPFYNRYTNIGVHNFSNGYTLELNNASDFAIGDRITVMTDCGFNMGVRELPGYYMAVTLGLSDIENSLHGGWLPECTITNKVGNTLYLDRPVFWGYIEGADSAKIIKTNRNFLITGTIGTTFADWRWPLITLNTGTATPRKYLFSNVRMDYIGSFRYSGSGTGNRGLLTLSQDYWNHALYDGIVKMMGPDSGTYNGVYFGSGTNIVRNSTILSNLNAGWQQGAPSFSGSAMFNNKIQFCLNGPTFASCRQFTANYNEIASCDVGIVLNGFRTDRMAMPSVPEVKFNTIKGTSNSGFSIADETVGPRRWSRIALKNNKIRGTDDYAITARAFDAFSHIDSNFMSDHTGARLSRYRNEGFFSEGDTSNDLSVVSRQINYGRFGYDIVHGVYHWYELDYSRPNVTRVYNPNGDAYFWYLGIELDILDDVAFKIQVQFDYRLPLMAGLQDDGNLDGQLLVYSLQNGSIIESPTSKTPTTAGTGWNTFSYTYEQFTSTAGRAGVFLSRAAQNGYVDFKNSAATVLTDNPGKIKVVGNTFDLNRIWDQHHEVRNMAPLTTPTRAINIRRLKF